MGAGTAVPWDTCAEPDCQGARVSRGGACLVHAPAEELPAASSTGRGIDIDGRGVRFNRAAVITLFDSVPEDEAGAKLFGTVRLDRATFDNDISFDGAQFTGDVSMVGTVFEGDTRFGGATFLGAADFSEATFGGQAWFVGVRFAGPASFRQTTFTGAAWLQKTSFEASSVFDGATFSTNATFSAARFAGAGSFLGARFNARALFDKATCAGRWRFEGATFRFEDDGPEGVVHDQAPPAAPPPPPTRDDRPVPVPPRPARSRANLVVPLIVLALLAVGAYVVLRPDPEASFKDYAFVHQSVRTKLPTRYNPCQPIRYVANLDRSPPDFPAALDQAVAEVAAATGIDFQSEGTTTEKANLALPGSEQDFFTTNPETRLYRDKYRRTLGRPSFQPGRYGSDRWAPVLITWAPFRAGNGPVGASGLAASDIRDAGDVPVYVSGTVVLNSEVTDRDLKARIMHELGHLVGLADVGSRTEVMSSSPEREATAWGPGDLEGLRRVGRTAGCLETPAPAPD